MDIVEYDLNSILTSLSTLRTLKEKVEEDRYIRAQENAWKEKLQGLRAVEEHKREAAVHHDVVKPVMDDVSKMLAETGDSVSDAALENLTKWKLDL